MRIDVAGSMQYTEKMPKLCGQLKKSGQDLNEDLRKISAGGKSRTSVWGLWILRSNRWATPANFPNFSLDRVELTDSLPDEDKLGGDT